MVQALCKAAGSCSTAHRVVQASVRQQQRCPCSLQRLESSCGAVHLSLHRPFLQGCCLLAVLVSDATAWEVGRGDAWQEGDPAAALALPDLGQGMQGQVDQQRVELPAPCSALHHGDIIIHDPGQDLEGSARPLFLKPCLWCRAER